MGDICVLPVALPTILLYTFIGRKTNRKSQLFDWKKLRCGVFIGAESVLCGELTRKNWL